RLRRAEVERGSSQFGPHRDDLHFGLGGRNLTQYGSQGQQRTAALALRLAQAQWRREQSDGWPLLLIDDVVHEMDARRRERFWRSLDLSGQMIVTGTDREHLGAGVEPAQIFRVEQGAISRM
ncbi:MAG: DNA replication/repair protein RecF, partial [Candidatus Hinthialibacter sp.]